MLNITAQSSAEGAKKYFAHSDYYMADTQEMVGCWGGKGAALLGLSGPMQKSDFDLLCDNLNPNTGKRLTAVNNANRRVGYDFTWSAPKSVSLMHALTGEDNIVTAFRDSIRETMKDMEGEMQCRVRKGKKDEDRTTANILYSEFVHLTSRPVAGVPDPQLHAHIFCLNATLDPLEDQWKAGQFGPIKSSAYYWQAVQQARFANHLQEIGYSIRKTKDAFEIVGVPQETLVKFSKRTAIIEKAAKDQGITDPKIKATLAASTREKKDNRYLYSELKELWDKRLTPQERQSLLDLADGLKPGIPKVNITPHVQFAVDHEFFRSSVVEERRLLTTALRHGIGEVTPEGVRREVLGLKLLKREQGGKSLVTTQAMVDEERRLITYVARSKGTCRPLVPDGVITLGDKELDAEQRAAVELPLRTADRIVIIRGKAGAGKTRSITEAVKQLKERGKEVVLVAPSTRAVGVLREEGFEDAATLARLLVDPQMQLRLQDGIIVLDEAGMVGSITMNKLFDLAKDKNCRIVLLGDTGQLPSVERGSPLRMLERDAGLKVVEISEIRRQSGDYREAVKLMAQGKAAAGLEKLDRMGCIKIMPVWDAYAPLAKDYVEKIINADESGRDRDKEVLIECPTHVEGQKATDAVRIELRRRELIGREERTFTRLVPLQWTDPQRGDAASYSGDEVLQFHRNSGAFRAGQRVSSKEILAKLPEMNPANFATFAPSAINLSAGDLVRATAKGKTLDGKHTLTNGAVYSIKGFDRRGDLVLGNGWVVSQHFGHLAHAYVNTAYAAQGRTCYHVLIAQSSMSYPASSREAFYVAASRGRKSVTIYTDQKRQLKEAVERSHPRLSALDLQRKARTPWWKQARKRIERIQMASMIAAKAAAQSRTLQSRELAYGR